MGHWPLIAKTLVAAEFLTIKAVVIKKDHEVITYFLVLYLFWTARTVFFLWYKLIYAPQAANYFAILESALLGFPGDELTNLAHKLVFYLLAIHQVFSTQINNDISIVKLWNLGNGLVDPLQIKFVSRSLSDHSLN